MNAWASEVSAIIVGGAPVISGDLDMNNNSISEIDQLVFNSGYALTVNNGNLTYDNYQISSLGRFKNSKGIIMENYKPHHNGYIYARVNYKKYALHILVAFTFIENPYSKPAVNHIDGNKTNNTVINFEWKTYKEISQHTYNIGLTTIFTRKIGQYNLNGELIKEFNSIVEAMKETNIKSIKQVLYKKQNTAGGFIWKYLD